MRIIIPAICSLVIFFPIIITIISFLMYNKSGNKKNLIILTLPNFILTVIIPVMLTFFATYGNSYVYALEAFLNGIANGKIYMWLLLIFIVAQIVITCVNGIYIVKEKNNQKYIQERQKRVFNICKSSIIVLVLSIVIFVVFFSIDIYMLENNKTPICSIETLMYTDGGTKEYLGLGYKIIDYNKLDGYDGYKIGTWFMYYDNSL